MKRLAGVLFGVLVFTTTVPAAAAILMEGQTLHYQYWYPTITQAWNPSDDFTVGAGIERTSIGGVTMNLDVSDTNILVDGFSRPDSWFATSFNGFSLYDVNGTISAFTSVAIDPATNMVGLDSSRITFDSDHIYVNWQGLAFDVNTVVSLDVDSAVPEPCTLAVWSLFGGIGTIVGYRRRKM